MILLKKHNNYIILGLLFNSIFLFLNNFNIVPELIKGLIFGLGISLILVGSYSNNHTLSKFKNYKHNLINKVFEQ